MRKQLLPALRMTVLLTVLTGLIYPIVITGLCRAMFHAKADGSLVQLNGKIIGSTLIAQQFTRPEYFHPRPSAAGNGYDATASGGSNLGPTSKKLMERLKSSAAQFRAENPEFRGAIPADAITTSGSGLDPEISVASANAQAARISNARGVTEKQIQQLIADHTQTRDLGFLGEPRLNVLTLNLALDTRYLKR